MIEYGGPPVVGALSTSNVAVTAAGASQETAWVRSPPSDQDAYLYRVEPWVWAESAPTVTDDPAAHQTE